MITAMEVAYNTQRKNIRHDIEPSLVRAQIEQTIARLEEDRIHFTEREQANLDSYEQAKRDGTAGRGGRVPEGPGYVDPMIDGRIELERTHYAKVRVLELPLDGKRFILAYGDVEDSTVASGTGPFESLDAAARWFLTFGR